MSDTHNHARCGDGTGCPWWCPVHDRHHPVANMVTHCIEATDPRVDVRIAKG